MGSFQKTAALVILFLAVSNSLSAHVIVGELENMSRGETAVLYAKLGFEHIIPLGFDHILFVIGLFLLTPKLKTLMWQATAFTVAHSVTLALAMYHVIAPPAAIVEPVIALSILYVALENIFSKGFSRSRIGIVFLFGLVHGMGFANSLGQLGLPENSYLSSLIMFNVGVEIGQITVILTCFFLLGKWLGHKPYYRKAVVIPLSLLIALAAGFWTIQRSFFN
jgi:uncharacterized membrane protein